MNAAETTTQVPAAAKAATSKSGSVKFGVVRVAVAFLMVAGLVVAGTSKAGPAAAATSTAQVTACFVHTNGFSYNHDVYLMYWNTGSGRWVQANAPVLRPGSSGCVSWNVLPGYYYQAHAFVKMRTVFSGWSPYYAYARGGSSYHLGTGTVFG